MIPYDKHLYSFDNHHSHDPFVQETTKVVEIKDNFGRTRFKVALTDFDKPGMPEHDDLRHFDYDFEVTVVSYCYGEYPLTIVCKEFNDICEAQKIFDKLVHDYRNIVALETKDYEDINIYAKRINYHKICPDCCQNCVFSRPLNASNCLFDHWQRHKGKLVCMNREQYKPLDENRHNDGYNQCDKCNCDHDFKRLEPSNQRHDHKIPPFDDITPEVDPFCICDGFKRKLQHEIKDPDHSEWAFENHDCNQDMVDETLSNAVDYRNSK